MMPVIDQHGVRLDRDTDGTSFPRIQAVLTARSIWSSAVLVGGRELDPVLFGEVLKFRDRRAPTDIDATTSRQTFARPCAVQKAVRGTFTQLCANTSNRHESGLFGS
jgi:hypothetical protein